jgi:hypothetical protein
VWAPGFFAHDTGGDVQDKRDTLVAACQLMGLSLAGLLVPGALIDLAFDTDYLSILAQATLAAFACALVVAVWTDYQD